MRAVPAITCAISQLLLAGHGHDESQFNRVFLNSGFLQKFDSTKDQLGLYFLLEPPFIGSIEIITLIEPSASLVLSSERFFLVRVHLGIEKSTMENYW